MVEGFRGRGEGGGGQGGRGPRCYGRWPQLGQGQGRGGHARDTAPEGETRPAQADAGLARVRDGRGGTALHYAVDAAGRAADGEGEGEADPRSEEAAAAVVAALLAAGCRCGCVWAGRGGAPHYRLSKPVPARTVRPYTRTFPLRASPLRRGRAPPGPVSCQPRPL